MTEYIPDAPLTAVTTASPPPPPPKENLSPDAVRARLLRPFPAPSIRSIVVLIVVVLLLSWCLSGVGPGLTNRITSFLDPFQATFNLIVRMFPPDFEIDRVRNVDVTLLGQTVSEFTITSSTVTLFGSELEIGWLPILTAVFETIQMAVIGTLGAVLMALPLSILAAHNTSPHPAIYQVTRLILNFLRSIPELVYALLFVAAVGLGPFTGVLALAFGSVGSLSRVFAEAIEQIDPAQVNAVRATGAGGLQTFIYAVMPQAFPLFISYAIIYFESNVRHATILGYVGAGGVGFLLFKYTGTSDYSKVLGAALVLVVAVTIIDRLSSRLRRSII
ncbi:MAG: phosphonate ABC transporter, permease protein PhnE [Chloroflexota bacterium]|nr:phosphonate ABC transporter, permease protein PhnE [Chloroflexota bacterium]